MTVFTLQLSINNASFVRTTYSEMYGLYNFTVLYVVNGRFNIINYTRFGQ